MPLSTSQYGFIIDPMVPFTDASGTTIRNGYVRVFVAGSSTPVITYKNYDGATNEETIQLDNSGRTAYPVIVSKGNTYKVCVYDAEHSQESPILTIDKVVPAGANVEATNIVTGLDNVESPEAGWVKSTVSGTDAEVSLDATNVTSEVDTMVKATAASADYMMPLVHKTGSDPDKKITLGNIFKFVLNFIHSLTDTATEADLVSGNYFALDGSAGTKKLNSTTLLTKTTSAAKDGIQPLNREVVLNYIFTNRGTNPSDLNDLKSNAIYLVNRDSSTATANFPSDFGTSGNLSILEITTAKYGSGSNDYMVSQKLTIVETGDSWSRRWSYLTGTWTAWVKLDLAKGSLNREVALNYIYASRATNPSDLNDLKSNAIYLVQRTAATTTFNFPSDFGTDGAISVLEITTAKYGSGANEFVVTQKLTKLENGDVWTRRWYYANGNWTDWVKIEVSAIKMMKPLVNAGNDKFVLGDNNELSANMNFGWASENNKGAITVKSAFATKDSLLTKIHLTVRTSGKYRFFTAMIDQNDYIAQAENFFDLDLVAGANNIDVTTKYIKIKKDFYLFVYNNYYDTGTGTDKGVAWLLSNNATSKNVEMLYNTPANPIVRVVALQQGGRVDFYWDAEEFSSAFALESELNSVNSKVDVVNEQLLTNKIITGANGKPYVLGVDISGNVVALVQEFSNALCIGNSLTDHAQSPDYGWYGDGWPMAASNATTGWVNELQEIFKQKDPDAVVGKIGGTTISAFERHPENYVADSDFDAIMGTYVGANLDFIIFKAGENVSIVSDYKDGLLRFFNYLQRKYPNAQIYVAQPFYAGTTVANAQQQAAIESHLTYIPDSESRYHKQQLGLFTYGSDDDEYPIVSSSVADHLGDVGFLIWANILANLFGYTPLDWRKSVTISAGVGIDYQVRENTGVKDGLYTILGKGTQPTVTVKDASNNAVSFTIHDMTSVSWKSTPNYVPAWAITFVVPATDVTVSLS